MMEKMINNNREVTMKTKTNKKIKRKRKINQKKNQTQKVKLKKITPLPQLRSHNANSNELINVFMYLIVYLKIV